VADGKIVLEFCLIEWKRYPIMNESIHVHFMICGCFTKLLSLYFFWANSIIQLFILPYLDPGILLIVMDEITLIGQHFKYAP
jgi:hypothetical protein